MQPISLRTGFLTLTLIAIASLTGGVLTACSNASQNESQASNATAATDAENHQHTDHGGSMNHSMDMDLGPADAEYDLRFLDGMILHHQGAVEMAKEAQQKSQRPEIKQLADNIITAQNKEIEQMQQWRKIWYPQSGAKPMAYNAQMGHTMEMSSDQMKSMMMSNDLGVADAEFDCRFIDGMVPHHEGALTMAQDALSKSQRPEIKQLAQGIISSQETEIKQMKQWRQAWYK